ncbi:RNA polymerase sigma factor [Planctomycetes bacterium MalM25]|nr:RNA polymerase sigma factor [Planctomycetes bacterium MalM25]
MNKNEPAELDESLLRELIAARLRQHQRTKLCPLVIDRSPLDIAFEEVDGASATLRGGAADGDLAVHVCRGTEREPTFLLRLDDPGKDYVGEPLCLLLCKPDRLGSFDAIRFVWVPEGARHEDPSSRTDQLVTGGLTFSDSETGGVFQGPANRDFSCRLDVDESGVDLVITKLLEGADSYWAVVEYGPEADPDRCAVRLENKHTRLSCLFDTIPDEPVKIVVRPMTWGEVDLVPSDQLDELLENEDRVTAVMTATDTGLSVKLDCDEQIAAASDPNSNWAIQFSTVEAKEMQDHDKAEAFRRLIKKAATGAADAVDAAFRLIDQYRPMMHGAAVRLTSGTAVSADDVVAEYSLLLIRKNKFEEFQPQQYTLKQFLRTGIKRTAGDLIKKSNRRQSRETTSQSENLGDQLMLDIAKDWLGSPDEHVQSAEMWEAIDEVKESLNGRDRRIVDAAFKGLNQTQLAEDLGISKGQASREVGRVGKQLTKLLEGLGYAPEAFCPALPQDDDLGSLTDGHKFTAEQEKLVRQLAHDGESLERIAVLLDGLGADTHDNGTPAKHIREWFARALSGLYLLDGYLRQMSADGWDVKRIVSYFNAWGDRKGATSGRYVKEWLAVELTLAEIPIPAEMQPPNLKKKVNDRRHQLQGNR